MLLEPIKINMAVTTLSFNEYCLVCMAALFVAGIIMGSVAVADLQAARAKLQPTRLDMQPAVVMGQQLAMHQGTLRAHGHVLVDGNQESGVPCDIFCNTSPRVQQVLGTASYAAWGGATSLQSYPQPTVSGGICDCIQDPSTPWGTLVSGKDL